MNITPTILAAVAIMATISVLSALLIRRVMESDR